MLCTKNQVNIFQQGIRIVIRCRHYILWAGLIYSAGVAAGFVYKDNLDFMQAGFQELVDKFAGLNAYEFILKIFLHNLMAGYLAMCFVVVWGLVPMGLAFFNGMMVGWFAGFADHLSLYELALMLVPHGLFEWPAMFIAFGVGTWRGLGPAVSHEQAGWLMRWKKAHLAYFTVVVPLLLAAAVVEGRYHMAGAAF
ncbi:MAG: stage II sporulation protein M [Desulfonatronovibrionaceae bacterium]